MTDWPSERLVVLSHIICGIQDYLKSLSRKDFIIVTIQSTSQKQL